MNGVFLSGGWKGLVLALLLAVRCGAAEPLPPPLELDWGGSPARLMALADRFGLDKTVRTPGKQPRMTIVKIGSEKGPLPGHHASEVEGRYIGGRLYEVTVHYTYPGKPRDFVKARFVELKKGLSTRYGAFQFNGKKKFSEGGVATSSESYHVNVADGRTLLLALTEVKDIVRGDSAATFSVVYHNASILAGP